MAVKLDSQPIDVRFQQLLMDSKSEEIKRLIGQAFLDILKQITFRRIIGMPFRYRSDEDNRKLFVILKKQQVFKQFYKLRDEDFVQLSRLVQYKEIQSNRILHSENEPMDKYYIVLRGKLTFYQRNPDIKDWDWAHKAYQ